MITEEECERRIKFRTEYLTKDLQQAREEAAAQKYRAKTLEWAMHGLMHHTGRVIITVNGPVGLKDANLLEMARHFGANAARQVLEESGIAFRDHAELYELRNHVIYLEGHARCAGLQFRSWDESKSRFGGMPAFYGQVDLPRSRNQNNEEPK